MKQRQKQQLKKENYAWVLRWIPLYAVFLILPFVRYYNLYESRFYGETFYIQDWANFDFDLYCKYTLFLVITAVVAVLLSVLVYQRRKELFQKNELRKYWYVWIPMGAYLLLSFLSSICSEHRVAAFTGADGQFESFFVWAGYLLLACYMMLLLRTERDAKCAAGAVLLGVAGQAILGIMQYTGNSPMNFEWYQRLITPEGYIETVGPVEVKNATVVSLLAYNSNYAGVLLAVFAAFVLAVLLTERRKWWVAGEFLLLLGTITALIGTESKAGFLVFGVSAGLAILFLARRIRRFWYLLIPGVTAVVLAGLLMIQHFDLPILKNIKNVLTVERSQEKNPLEKIITSDSGVEITYKGTYVKLRLNRYGNEFSVLALNSAGERITLQQSEDGSHYVMEQEGLQEIEIVPVWLDERYPAVNLSIDGTDWLFVTGVDGSSQYYYINWYGNLDELTEVKRLGFRGYERLASGRGFIWSQTLPVLLQNIILGEGSNCFAFAYPQNNYREMIFLDMTTTTTNPHCMYLQVGVEAGVLALVALLVFWAVYLVDSVRIYFRCAMETVTERVGFACFLATFVYLVCSLSNDSLITVSPMIWAIIGIGLGANRMIKANGPERKEAK